MQKANAKLIKHFECTLSKIMRIVLFVAKFIGLAKFSVFFRRVYWRSCLGGIGQDCYLYPRVVIHSPRCVVIGDRVSIAEFVHIWGGGGVEIGNDVMIASHCAISSQTHNTDPIRRKDNVMRKVTIYDNVWIGAGAIILPGVSIGKNSVVAAGSVVTRDVASDTVVRGVPAIVVRAI